MPSNVDVEIVNRKASPSQLESLPPPVLAVGRLLSLLRSDDVDAEANVVDEAVERMLLGLSTIKSEHDATIKQFGETGNNSKFKDWRTKFGGPVLNRTIVLLFSGEGPRRGPSRRTFAGLLERVYSQSLIFLSRK